VNEHIFKNGTTRKEHDRQFSPGGFLPFHVSLFILVPFIFAGLALMAFLVAGQVTGGYWIWGGFAVILFAALAGVAVTVALLRPLRKFLEDLRQFPVFPREAIEGRSNLLKRTDLSRFEAVFDEVTNLISKVDARERFPGVSGQSTAIRTILSQVIKVAPTNTTVLILGESGVGKEVIAEAIYRESERRDRPFIKLNCVAIPQGLLESELFGHEKGAFTGAVARKKGKFELAHEGTLFLDEIGDMPLETQAKLLRVLQERSFERVGGNETISVDVRFIAASNKNLQLMAEEGLFRDDLFYRLNVFSIYIPPLRDRIEDIPVLAARMLEELPGPPHVSSGAMRELMTYDWPGNVRELKNVLERAAVMADDGHITSTGLERRGTVREPAVPPRSQRVTESFGTADVLEEDFHLDQCLADYEKKLILAALTEAGGVQSQAARILGINQRSLWHRIKKYGIDPKQIKEQCS
jgi:transcriptional regulator with GAF, ATPase, and Fis domain